jgi:predicted kinase
MSESQRPLLVAFLGSIGVGKSFFARQLAPEIGAVRLNADAARLSMFGSLENVEAERQFFGEEANKRLFGVIDYAVKEILTSGKSVVYDSARFNGKRNRDILKMIATDADSRLVFVWIETPRKVAFDRVLVRDEATDSRRLDQKAAEKIMTFHDEHFDAPHDDEFVIKIDGTVPFAAQYDSFIEQLNTSS